MGGIESTLMVTLGTIVFFAVLSIVITIAAFAWMRNLGAGGVKNGVTASGTILRTWDTGTTVNEDPVVGFELEVRPANEAAFRVEMKQLVSRIQIGAFLPGMPVEVMYDPANHKKIKIQGVGAGMGAAMGVSGAQSAGMGVGQLQQMLLAKDQLLEAVRSMGVAAEATILKVTDMGVQIGDNAAMKKLNLEVRPSDRPAFHAETQGAISTASNDKYQPGKTIWVKFNPNDMTQVALDHA